MVSASQFGVGFVTVSISGLMAKGCERISLMTASAGGFGVPAFRLIFAPLKGYDEQEILPSQKPILSQWR